MPELPEVETVRADLQQCLPGRRVQHMDILLPRLLKNSDATHFAAAMAGRTFTEVTRKGKYLMLCMDGPQALLVHLRMTGRLVFESRKNKQQPSFARIIFELDRGRLTYGDVRTLGCLWLVPATGATGIPGYDRLGPDAIHDKAFTISWLGRRLEKKKQTIKGFLLDQTNVAGLGNIYVDEALFRAGIRPTRHCDTLTKSNIRALHAAIGEVMKAGLAHGGTTVRNFVDGNGREGNNQHFLCVYGQEGLPCKKCGTTIVYEKLNGRGTHYCPHCQK